MERTAFLQKAREATLSAILPPHPERDPGGWVPPLVEVDLVDHFTAKLTGVHGEVHTGSPAEVIDELIDRHDAVSFVSWDLDQIDGLVSLPEHIERLDSSIPQDPSHRRERNVGFLDVRIGITGAEAGFSETGTIVLRSGSGRPRMASLVPLVHIAVLSRERLFRSASHWAADEKTSVSDSANVIFITGPSKTGDIESITTMGIHGPKHLHVILV